MLNSATDMMLALLNIRTLAVDMAESIHRAQGKLLYAFFFCLPLAICCTCVQENVGNWPLFKLDSEWTCECKWMLSCYFLKQTCMLLFTGISSNAIFVFCQCLVSMYFFSLVIYMIDYGVCLRTAYKHIASFCECGNKLEGCRGTVD